MVDILKPGPGEEPRNEQQVGNDNLSRIDGSRWLERTQLDSRIEIMCAAGLKDDEILRLAYLKHRVDAGEASDLTMEYKRFMFLKHLYNAGIVGG